MMASCGYHALIKLCQLHGIVLPASQWTQLEEIEELSFMDFQKVFLLYGYRSQGLLCLDAVPTPCIASMEYGSYQHFVVILHYSWLVSYFEPRKGKRYLPRVIFDVFFTKKVFVADCF